MYVCPHSAYDGEVKSFTRKNKHSCTVRKMFAESYADVFAAGFSSVQTVRPNRARHRLPYLGAHIPLYATRTDLHVCRTAGSTFVSNGVPHFESGAERFI